MTYCTIIQRGHASGAVTEDEAQLDLEDTKLDQSWRHKITAESESFFRGGMRLSRRNRSDRHERH